MKHKCLAAFIVFILFFSISGLIMVYQFYQLKNPKFVIRVLDQSGIYNNLDTIGELVTSGGEQNSASKMYVRALTKNVDPAWVQSQVETNLPIFMNYLSGKSTSLNVNFDLAAYKDKLPASFKSAIAETVKELPVCEEGQPQTEDDFPTCLPPGTSADQVVAQISPAELQSLVNEVPNSFDLSQSVKNPDQTFGSAKLGYKITNFGMIALLIFSVILLGILVLLGLSYPISIPRWIGVALVLPAGMNLLLEGIFILTRESIQQSIFKNLNPQYLPVIAPIFQSFYNNFTQPALIISGVLAGFGFILIILSYIISHPPEVKSEILNPKSETNPKPQNSKV